MKFYGDYDEDHDVTHDFSNGAEAVLIISELRKDSCGRSYSITTILDANDESGNAEWINNNIGETLHQLNGCPVYMELSAWAYNNAGVEETDYSFDNYDGLDNWSAYLDYYGE